MNRPLLKAALLYAGGIWLGEQVAVPWTVLLSLAWALALSALLIAKTRVWFLPPLLLLAGGVNVTLQRAVLAPDDLRVLIGAEPAWVKVRGGLDENTDVRTYPRKETEVARTFAQLRVRSLRRDGRDWESATGRVMVLTEGALARPLWQGQAVEIEGIIEPPGPPLAPGLFDYRTYLRHHGIHYQLRVESPAAWTVVPPERAPGLADRYGEWARANLARGLPPDDDAVQLLWAMTLGWRTALTGEMSEPFMRSGTLHVFAISGLHVALVCAILVVGLRSCRVPRSVCGWVVIPLLWFYAAVTGWPASAVRSTVMMTVIVAGWSLHRPSDLLNSLAAAGLGLLIWEPRQLFQASFQLSFFVVLSLALFGPLLQRVGRGLWSPDPLLPETLRSPWQRRLEKGWRWLLASLLTSLAAWLGSIPLIAHYFHLFTPVSLVANVAVVNLAAAALTSSLASLGTGSWLPGVAELFNNSAWFFMRCMIWVSRETASWPGAWFYVASPSGPGWLLYYGTLISVCAGWLARPKWRVGVGALLGAMALWWIGLKLTDAGRTRLTVLPLSGGHAVYADAPGWHQNLLVDCGDDAAANFMVSPFLQAQGVNRLPALALTHGDVRHVGGATELKDTFALSRVWLSPLRFRSPLYRQWQTNESPGVVQRVQRGETIAQWQVLHPAADDRFDLADDGSLVLWADLQGTRVLLLGDLGKPGQAALLNRQPELRADIVVAGLPVKTEPLDTALIHTLQPQVIIIADALYPAPARASRPLQARLASQRVPVLYTRKTGAVTITIRRDGWRLVGMNGVEVRAGEAGKMSNDQGPITRE